MSFTNARVNANCSPTRAALFTGRSGLRTGVIGVLRQFKEPNRISCADYNPITENAEMATDLLSLQAYERTIAEALQAAGYYTILIDKWHVGANLADDANRGLKPTQQGFDIYEDWLNYICLDNENSNMDTDHMVRMAKLAVDAVNNDETTEPWTLFFHTISPHRRHPDSGGRMWWKVDEDLISLSKHLGNSNKERFVQNLEAIDTVIREYLLEPHGVITDITYVFDYVEDSNTVIFIMSDNGTDQAVSSHGRYHAKGSPYMGGINKSSHP